jgi:hypothetical protein
LPMTGLADPGGHCRCPNPGTACSSTAVAGAWGTSPCRSPRPGC